MEVNSRIEWLYEGDSLDGIRNTNTHELRDRLLEAGAVQASPNGGLVIRFVGVLVFYAKTIVVLPKIRVAVPPDEVQRQVIRALRVYAKWIPPHHEPSPHLNSSPDRGQVSGIAAADWLLNDFLAHGLYRRTEVDFGINGAGRINWAATIAKMQPIFSHGRPIYVNTITRRSENDPSNFVTMLHRYLLEQLSKEFGSLLGHEQITLDYEPVDRFDVLPAVDECERWLAAEMRLTYSERGLELLEMLLAIVKALDVEHSRNLALYGTNSFHHVWEAICGTVFGNIIGDWQPFLPCPIWTAMDGAQETTRTFIPDIVVPLEGKHKQLLIADAKYYRPSMPPRLRGVPGVNDVAKQIWYKQHLVPLANERGYTKIQNVFLFPAQQGSLANLVGSVEFPKGGEKIDAVNIDFMLGLKIYASGSRGLQETSRRLLVEILSDAGESSVPC